jgi:hypothetical protein
MSTISTRKMTLLEKLKSKVSECNHVDDSEKQQIRPTRNRPTHLVGNRHAEREERIVEFGWLHRSKDGGIRKQVVKKFGGGKHSLRGGRAPPPLANVMKNLML